MKSSKEYYSEIYYSGADRYFECKMRAQEYYINRLPETDYVRLLTLQLYDKEGLTYNRILFIAPDIIQTIDKQVESSFGKQDGIVKSLQYEVVFDEIIEDAKKVEKTMSTGTDSSSKELKSYEFKVWIDGNYYYEDEEIEAEIMLSDDEVETIKKLVREYDADLSCGLMPILKKGDVHLYNKFFSEIYPPVFYELFQRDEMFEPIPGDEGKEWEEEDVIYLMETYGDGYCFDDAYKCYIPEDMMPSKMTLTKGMSKDDYEECQNNNQQKNDLRQIIEDDYLYVTIQEKLIQAAHEYYVQEGINDGMTREEAENVELIGNEYSCPIPEAWK